MARKEELFCLERLKKIVLENDGGKVNFDNTESSFSKLLASSRPNESSNDFPDFFFDGGAIEHFLIGSSKEGRKGSEFKRLENEERDEKNRFLEQEKQAFMQSSTNPGTLQTASFETRYEGFTYEAFLKSLERNWLAHLESLKKCEQKYKNVVFLMEQQTPRMCLHKDGVFKKFYLLSQDKKALSLIAKHSEGIQYAVYLVNDSVEVIDLAKLPELLASAENNIEVRGGRLIDATVLLCFDMPDFWR